MYRIQDQSVRGWLVVVRSVSKHTCTVHRFISTYYEVIKLDERYMSISREGAFVALYHLKIFKMESTIGS